MTIKVQNSNVMYEVIYNGKEYDFNVVTDNTGYEMISIYFEGEPLHRTSQDYLDVLGYFRTGTKI